METTLRWYAVHDRGKIVQVRGKPLGPVDLAFVGTNEIIITGTLAGPNVFPGLLRLMAEGTIKTGPLITHRLPLAGVPEAFRTIEARSEPYVKKIVVMQDEGFSAPRR